MDTYKIIKANELYSKIQGALWALEKCEEYEHYGQCENIRKKKSQWLKELQELNLTNEEKEKVGYEFVDNDLAQTYYWRLRA